MFGELQEEGEAQFIALELPHEIELAKRVLSHRRNIFSIKQLLKEQLELEVACSKKLSMMSCEKAEVSLRPVYLYSLSEDTATVVAVRSGSWQQQD